MPIPVITQIAPQNIWIDNSDWKVDVPISNSPTLVRVLGMTYPFYSNWIASRGILELKGNPARLLSGTWIIQASNNDGSADNVEVQFNVVPRTPAINSADLAEVTIRRGRSFSRTVRITNGDAFVESDLLNLDHESVSTGVRIFGTVPSDAVFLVRSGRFKITVPHPVDGFTAIDYLPWRFPPSRPLAPRNLRANGLQGGGRVRLDWDAPLDDGGSTITGYRYSVSGGTWVNTNSINTFVIVPGLTNLQSYDFRVQAINDVGISDGVGPVTAIPIIMATAPHAPGNFVVTPGNGNAVLTWTAPHDGGHTIDRYEYQLNGAGWFNMGVPDPLSYTIPNLMIGSTNNVRIRAVNQLGNGVATSLITFIPRTVPNAPTSLTGSALSGGVRLSWTAPTNTGGLPILYYEYRIGTSGTWTSTGSAATTFDVLGLREQTTLFVRAVTGVLAETERYASAASNSVTVTPLSSVSTVPTGLNLTVSGSVSESIYRFTWDAPSDDGGSPILDYETEVRLSINTNLRLGGSAGISATSRSFSFGPVIRRTDYSFRVRARNANGNSEWASITSG